MKSSQHLTMALVGALVTAAPLRAQDDGTFTPFENTTQDSWADDLANAGSASEQTKAALKDEEGGYIRHFGDGKYRGSMRFYAKIEGHNSSESEEVKGETQSASKASILVGGVVDANIQGVGLEALRVEYDFLDKDSPWAVKVAGYTVKIEEKKAQDGSDLQQSSHPAQTDAQVAESMLPDSPRKLLPKDYKLNIWLGFPVVIMGNFGVGVDSEIVATADVLAWSFCFESKVNPYLYGWVAGGVGYVGPGYAASVGLAADLRLLDVSAGTKLGITPEHTVCDLELEVTALKMRIYAYTKLKFTYWMPWVGWTSWTKKWSLTIYSFSCAAYEKSAVLFGPEA